MIQANHFSAVKTNDELSGENVGVLVSLINKHTYVYFLNSLYCFKKETKRNSNLKYIRNSTRKNRLLCVLSLCRSSFINVRGFINNQSLYCPSIINVRGQL